MLRITLLPILALALALPTSAQTLGGSGPPVNLPNRPLGPSPNDAPTPPVFISGKVAIDDGTALTARVAIQSVCQGRTHIETYTDLKGQFGFEVRSPDQSHGSDTPEDASDAAPTMLGNGAVDIGIPGTNQLQDYVRECQLQAVLPGFTSEILVLAGKSRDVGNTDVGTLVLHRMAEVEGFTISATTGEAPSSATKEYEKGLDLEKKKKWDDALGHFQKAVEQYPQFAVAWLEIGRMELEKGELQAAKLSLQKSLSADAKFVSPYHVLAQIAGREQNWQQMVGFTDQLLKLNPVNFPQDWLLNAIGNFYLGNFDAAAKSAARGVEADTEHQFPRLEYVLGIALERKADYAGALLHVNNYLKLAPHATDVPAIQKQADEIEKLYAQVKSGG